MSILEQMQNQFNKSLFARNKLKLQYAPDRGVFSPFFVKSTFMY